MSEERESIPLEEAILYEPRHTHEDDDAVTICNRVYDFIKCQSNRYGRFAEFFNFLLETLKIEPKKI